MSEPDSVVEAIDTGTARLRAATRFTAALATLAAMAVTPLAIFTPLDPISPVPGFVCEAFDRLPDSLCK